jgi:hypothetical protein
LLADLEFAIAPVSRRGNGVWVGASLRPPALPTAGFIGAGSSTVEATRGGRPHITGVGALWVDGAFWFETGEGTHKARNLARDPRCLLSVATQQFDLVVNGEAHQVADPEKVATAWSLRRAGKGSPLPLRKSWIRRRQSVAR